MSTTFVSLSLEAMKEDLMEYITDQPFDMLEEFPEEEIADCVLAIASHLMLPASVVTEPLTSCGGIWNYQIKVNNTLKGFVSVSCEETGTTGVSETLYYPFFKDEEDGYFAGLCSLASMINEAWYICNN
jgi:hypothetical protein